MSSAHESQRIDLLLALALVFGVEDVTASGEQAGARRAVETSTRVVAALKSLSTLAAPERLALERRADWFARLAPDKQRQWLAHMLARARARSLPALDEHLHPSHIVGVLREEPRHIRRLIIQHLPPGLAAQVAQALGVEPGARHSSRNLRQPAPEVVAVVRRTFLSHFVSAHQLTQTTALDSLSGVELVRLVRLLGVCETGLACRGIESRESVASFLRRFSAADARAIASHIASLTEVEPARVAFAEGIVREAISLEPEPGAMLDRAGLHLLALTLAGRDETRLRYTAQKLPFEIAQWLRTLAAKATTQGAERASEMIKLVARDTEALAENVKRPAPRDGARRSIVDADARGIRHDNAGADNT